jgi:hypothetical protein
MLARMTFGRCFPGGEPHQKEITRTATTAAMDAGLESGGAARMGTQPGYP